MVKQGGLYTLNDVLSPWRFPTGAYFNMKVGRSKIQTCVYLVVIAPVTYHQY